MKVTRGTPGSRRGAQGTGEKDSCHRTVLSALPLPGTHTEDVCEQADGDVGR